MKFKKCKNLKNTFLINKLIFHKTNISPMKRNYKKSMKKLNFIFFYKNTVT
jgi:hypothetical protein